MSLLLGDIKLRIMKLGKSLAIPLLLCNGARFLLGATLLAATAFFVHLLSNPANYREWSVIPLLKSTLFSYRVVERWNGSGASDVSLFLFSNISKTSICINYLQFLLQVVLFFVVLGEFSKVIRSVMNIETFHMKNVTSFRKISKYLLAICLLSSITIIDFKDASLREFSPSFSLLCYSIIAYIFSMVFYQGNQLYEEEKLTV